MRVRACVCVSGTLHAPMTQESTLQWRQHIDASLFFLLLGSLRREVPSVRQTQNPQQHYCLQAHCKLAGSELSNISAMGELLPDPYHDCIASSAHMHRLGHNRTTPVACTSKCLALRKALYASLPHGPDSTARSTAEGSVAPLLWPQCWKDCSMTTSTWTTGN